MLTKEDLIYLGAILLWQSPRTNRSTDDAINAAKEFYNKIFDEND